MLYQQGLTELIHSTPSEQVAYLLVERASLLEMNQDPGELTCDGHPESRLRTDAEPLNTSISPSTHKRAPRHLQSSLKKLFGLHKTSESKHTFLPGGETLLSGQPGRLEKECSRLERDVEEGSRRLAMAHTEIRRLKDELESAHFTQKAYEPELQSAQEEVKQLRKEVEKLKQYEMVELRKAKELNDRLDLEIRDLRNRVRSLDAEKNSLKKTVASQDEKVDRLKSALLAQQWLLTGEIHADQDKDNEKEKAEGTGLTKKGKSYIYLQEQLTAKIQQPMDSMQGSVESLQEVVKQLELAVWNLQGSYGVQTRQANELSKVRKTDVIQVDETCKDEQNRLSLHTNCRLPKQSEKQRLQLLENYHSITCSLIAEPVKDTCSQQEFLCRTQAVQTQPLHESLPIKACPGCLEARQALLHEQDEHETLKRQICEALNCIDEERSKYHSMKERFIEKLCRAKQKLEEETTWRDQRINNLERELSLCCHSIKKEKEVVEYITMENEKLLSERRKLLQQLSEEEDNMKNSKLTASLSKNRVKHLETENKNLVNKILQMSNQIVVLERRLQNMQSLCFAEDLRKMLIQQKSIPVSLQTARLTSIDIQGLLDSPHSCDTKQADLTSSPGFCASAALTAELGYLNLNSTQRDSDKSSPPSAFITSENTTS
ncbi:coiled-coil domain-containing protein 30 isoform X1 [Fundulus heteroclitus]|uniref:coiled-coil domain-containing protein 30 isoform X1 n=2 Tax=Fundulus heteroclitus TaxID=8078 RepID=UPI00165C48A7|nr:coiled-coil domain-containing protein 30 isoform X1 [Fundulus heteroclitus]